MDYGPLTTHHLPRKLIPMSSPFRVLHLEDDLNDFDLIGATLEAEGIACERVRVGTRDDFLAAMEPCCGFDLILADFNLPGFDGISAMGFARERCPRVPFIFVSGALDEDLAIESLKHGATDYVFKHRLSRLGPALRRALQETREKAELKRTEAEHKKLAHHVHVLMDSIAEGVYGIDLRGRCTFINESAARMLGWEPKELLGKDMHQLMHHHKNDGSTYPVEDCPIYQAFWTGKGCYVDSEVLWRKDGTSFPAEYRSHPIFEGEELAGAAMAFNDITERKMAQEALQESNRHLAQALADLRDAQSKMIQQERLQALGQMASGIAHDFNNALSPILGFSEILLLSPADLDNKDRARKFLEIINTSAMDAANVVRRLRQFYRARDEQEVFLPLSVNQEIEQAIAMTAPKWKDQTQAAGKQVLVSLDAQDVPPVDGNASEIRQALTNLILNAVDAMPGGGVLALRTRLEAQHVLIEVCDTGAGMTEEVRERCLEPFFTTKGERGTGLGLAMVQGIIRRHEGAIDIQSKVGQGTTITIRLPAYSGERSKDAGTKPPQLVCPLRILVVDDEPLVGAVTAEFLIADGHSVEIAADAPEGLRKFHAGQFDLVITDRAMPDMPGDQVAAKIKDFAPGKPVIMLTGFGDLMKHSGERPPCVDKVISKPVTMSAIRSAIAEVMAG